MTRKGFIFGTWLGALVLAGLLLFAYRTFMSSIPPSFQPSSFVHPEYGFMFTVPVGMRVQFNRYPTATPPYDSIALTYLNVPQCSPGADCPPQAEVRVAVWKVDNAQSFFQLLASNNAYGTSLTEAQSQDVFKYRDQNGWDIYHGPNSVGAEVYYAYSPPRQVLLKFENANAGPAMETVIRSLQ